MSANPRVMSITWNLMRGGTEGQCARTAMEACRQGFVHRVGVFRKEGFLLPAVEARCGPVYLFDIRKMYGPSTWFAIRRLARYLRKEKIEVLHLWDMDACLFGARAARLAGIPYLTSRRDMGEIYPWYKMRKLRKVEAKAARVIVNAVAILKAAAEDGVDEKKLCRVPNLLDIQEFDALAQEPYAGLDHIPPGIRVVMVARLDAEKDVMNFVQAASYIQQAGGKARFIVVGDGPDRAKAEAMVAELHLQEFVFFLGEVPHVPALLRQVQIGVLCPKSNEGLSNTILEYMAAGLPVVATDCGGNRELVVKQYNGELVPTGKSRALAQAIHRLLDDEPLRARYGQIGRAAIERQHHPAHVVDRFNAVYREVLNADA